MKNPLNDILAVLVLYRRDLAASETFNSLSSSLNDTGSCLDLFVYDNSPSPIAEYTASTPWRIHYLHDPTNPGVSRAYNEGWSLARQLGRKWLLLLDQDTFFPEGALAAYCEAVETHPDAAVIAPMLKSGERICSPCRYLFRTGFHLKNISPGVEKFAGRAVLNSGLLVSMDMFERCGGFDERIRLDFADFVFNNRLRRYCDTFYLLPIQCRHGFSGGEEISPEDALRRFEFFCEGAVKSVQNSADALLYSMAVLKRCLRLTFQFNSVGFIATTIKYLVKR